MLGFTVEFYEDAYGDKPIENFLLSLDIKMRAKLLEIRGKVGTDITRGLKAKK